MILHCDRTKVNGHKLSHRKVPLNMKKNFFTSESDGALEQAAQRCWKFSLKDISKQPAVDILQTPLPTPAILGF